MTIALRRRSKPAGRNVSRAPVSLSIAVFLKFTMTASSGKQPTTTPVAALVAIDSVRRSFERAKDLLAIPMHAHSPKRRPCRTAIAGDRKLPIHARIIEARETDASAPRLAIGFEFSEELAARTVEAPNMRGVKSRIALIHPKD